MLDQINVTCSGIPYTLDKALDYGMKIDDGVPTAEVIASALDECPTVEQLEELEEDANDWEEKHDSEQERADIQTDIVNDLDKQLNDLSDAHDKLEVLNDKLESEIESLQGSSLSRQCKAKDKWIEKLLQNEVLLEAKIENLEMINEL